MGVDMEIKILEKDNKSIRFLIKGVETPIVNGLRRIMIAEVPSMAIEDVVIIENSSPMKDETLAHRLGLIPLKTDLDSYILPAICSCQSNLGCNKCSVTLTLDAETKDSPRTVYSKELKSDDAEIVPCSDDIPLLKLASGQKIRLEAYAKLGLGATHAKWQPVSACTYRYAPTVIIDLEKCDLCEKCIKSCKKQILKKEKKKIILVDSHTCDLCKECIKSCPTEGIQIDKHTYIFKIESVGSLTPERIVIEATRILNKKIDTIINQVPSLKKEEKA